MNNFAIKLILASNSPRRSELLYRYGFEFEVIKSDYKEEKFEIFSYENIKKNSYGKALDVAQRIDFDAMVIGADTMVILDSVCLNKPQDISEAIFMLKNLSGRTHSVVTAISLVDSKTFKEKTQFVETKVTFRHMGEDEIVNYIKTKNPIDKAGSYGIQDFVSEKESNNPPKESFIKKIEGDYYNVMGLSVEVLKQMLLSF